MTDWRYWITYTGKIRTPSNDEDVARLAAAEQHAELIHAGAIGATVYLPEVEVEHEGGKGE